jgi:hypothetical protein
MAHGSQYLVQNMENQNGFDLERALCAWRDDCASRPGISLDNARELESDLRDRIANLLKQGLNEKEAFSRGVGQIGSPAELAREFARENPLAVWRERLFWIIAAGFGVSVWQLLTSGTILWFVNTFGVLLPFHDWAWFSLCANLPLLALGVLLASGKLQTVPQRVRSRAGLSTLRAPHAPRSSFFGRRNLALAGGCSLAAGLAMTLFGPHPLTAPESLPVKVIGLSLWPLILLSVGISLFRPARASKSTGSALAPLRPLLVVWRERVFWMAVGALAVGVWRGVSWVSVQALFYTGDVNKPFSSGPVFFGSWLLILLSPLVVLGLLLRQRMRAGKDVTAGKLIRKRTMTVFVPAVVCAWTALHLWSQHYWNPPGFGISWSSVVANYFTTFQWLWPAGLALLILWLAPREDTRGSLATATD